MQNDRNALDSLHPHEWRERLSGQAIGAALVCAAEFAGNDQGENYVAVTL